MINHSVLTIIVSPCYVSMLLARNELGIQFVFQPYGFTQQKKILIRQLFRDYRSIISAKCAWIWF